jgi:hypothetical protein
MAEPPLPQSSGLRPESPRLKPAKPDLETVGVVEIKTLFKKLTSMIF